MKVSTMDMWVSAGAAALERASRWDAGDVQMAGEFDHTRRRIAALAVLEAVLADLPVCHRCGGSGWEREGVIGCAACHGRGLADRAFDMVARAAEAVRTAREARG